MSPPFLIALSAIAVATPAFARMRPASVYPLAGEGLSRAECSDVEATLQAALTRASRVGPFVRAAKPSVTESCGPGNKADLACLARAAGTGVVLFGVARQSGGRILVDLSAIGARGLVSGPVRAVVDPFIDNPAVFNPVLARLAAGVALSGPAAAPVAAAPPLAAPAPGAASAVAAPAPGAASAVAAPIAARAPAAAPSPAARSPRAPARVPAPAEATAPANPDRWLLRGALASGALSVAAAGGAIAFGYTARKASNDLTTRYAAHTLSTADASAYGRISRDSNVANGLIAASATLAVTSLVLWALTGDGAPEASAGGL